MSESLPKKKKLDVRTIFEMRLKRDGRWDEYSKACSDLMAATGKRFGQVRWEAMKKCGYTTPEAEHALHAEFVKSEMTAALQADQDGFDRAVAALPASSSGEVEMEWIMSHPILLKRARCIDEDAVILLNSYDLDKAPSRQAVTLLQWFVRSPTKMFEQLTSELKKKVGSGEASTKGVSKDEDLEEVKRLLAEVQG